MPVQLGDQGQSGFDEPLGLLSDCHRRIEHFLGVLARVIDAAAGGPLDAEQHRAIESALTYFREAAPRHTADEEESLFPRLRDAGDPRVKVAMAAVARLEAEHDEAWIRHQEVDALFNQWLAADRLDGMNYARLLGGIHALLNLYGRHIAVEDTEVFPLAAQILSPAEVRAIGREMAGRRGLKQKGNIT